ncbi:MAG: hypothetical protein U9N57_03000 [Pseudomonadota bacterium]|nr:hypothetical protein [Pseudomonadota bacterium]
MTNSISYHTLQGGDKGLVAFKLLIFKITKASSALKAGGLFLSIVKNVWLSSRIMAN